MSDLTSEFVNPSLANNAGAFNATSIEVSHPLGDCIMRADAIKEPLISSVDVFDESKVRVAGFLGVF